MSNKANSLLIIPSSLRSMGMNNKFINLKRLWYYLFICVFYTNCKGNGKSLILNQFDKCLSFPISNLFSPFYNLWKFFNKILTLFAAFDPLFSTNLRSVKLRKKRATIFYDSPSIETSHFRFNQSPISIQFTVNDLLSPEVLSQISGKSLLNLLGDPSLGFDLNLFNQPSNFLWFPPFTFISCQFSIGHRVVDINNFKYSFYWYLIIKNSIMSFLCS